jgi:hypothetical protein
MRLFYTSVFLMISLFFITSVTYSYEKRDNCRRRSIDKAKNALPTGYNNIFAGAGVCIQCHNSQVNDQGEAVHIVDDWRSSMMASSAKDPFWQAKVSHETIVDTAHAEILENVCTTCHAPLGNFNAHHTGQPYFSLDEMKADTLAMDGVSCTMCHQIRESSLGNYSGTIQVDTINTIWGPFQNPFSNPMISNTGYSPEYGQQVFDSRLCAGCHTLITNPVDLNGVPTGTEFIEQAVYQEWQNSVYISNNTSCQSCHIPEINDAVQISSVPPWLQGQSPFGMHHLAGANAFMLQLMKDSINTLGITATEAQLDTTISRVTKMLQEKSIVVNLTQKSRTPDTLYVDLEIENIAGHKFPTAFPSRRAFIELFVKDDAE